MANIFGFGTYGCILAHQIRFHCECNTEFNLFDWYCEYNESGNQLKVVFELLCVQMYFSVSSNCQDCWFDTSESYFIREEHNKLNKNIEKADNSDYTDLTSLLEGE